MNPGAVFSGRSVVWLVAIGSTAFVAVLLAQIFGDRLGLARSHGPDASSVSAIGTRAFMKVLGRLGIPVVQVSEEAGRIAGQDAVLVVTDSSHELATQARRKAALGGVARAIVILPKWSGEAGTPDNRWIGPVRPAYDTEYIWGRLLPEGTVVHDAALEAPVGDLAGLAPSLPRPQLVRGEGVTPLLAYDAGILIGELAYETDGETTQLVVLADPDLLANHNLDAGDNAVLAVRMVERIRPAGAALVFATPGAASGASFWQRLFALPYAVFTLLGLLALIVVVWSGTGRFGSPRRVAPPIKAGREQLIANAADLLDHARHGPAVLASYGRAVIHDTARALNAPRKPDDEHTARWLDKAARRRGKPPRARVLLAAALDAAAGPPRASRSLVRTALALHAWKETMTDGA